LGRLVHRAHPRRVPVGRDRGIELVAELSASESSRWEQGDDIAHGIRHVERLGPHDSVEPTGDSAAIEEVVHQALNVRRLVHAVPLPLSRRASGCVRIPLLDSG